MFLHIMSFKLYARPVCFLPMTAWLFFPFSRQTQWDPPTWESPGDDASLEHEAEMDLGTPTYDENPMKVSVVPYLSFEQLCPSFSEISNHVVLGFVLFLWKNMSKFRG